MYNYKGKPAVRQRRKAIGSCLLGKTASCNLQMEYFVKCYMTSIALRFTARFFYSIR